MSLVPVLTTLTLPRPDLAVTLPAPLPTPQEGDETETPSSYLLADSTVRNRVREAFFSNVPRDDLLSRLTEALLRTPLPHSLVQDMNELPNSSLPSDDDCSPLLAAVRSRVPSLFSLSLAPEVSSSSAKTVLSTRKSYPSVLPDLAPSRSNENSAPADSEVRLPPPVTAALSLGNAHEILVALAPQFDASRMNQKQIDIIRVRVDSYLRPFLSALSSSEDSLLALTLLPYLYETQGDDEVLEGAVSAMSLLVSKVAWLAPASTERLCVALEWLASLSSSGLELSVSHQRRLSHIVVRLLTHPAATARADDLQRLRTAAQGLVCLVFSRSVALRPSIIEELCESAYIGASEGKPQPVLQASLACLLSSVQRSVGALSSSEWLEADKLTQGLCSIIARELWRHCVASQRPEQLRLHRENAQLLARLLLAKVFDPSWPAAAELVTALARLALQTSTSSHDDGLRSLSLKLVSQFLLHERKSSLSVASGALVRVPYARSVAASEAAEDVNSCPCQIPVAQNTPALDCDRCHRWFHLRCVELDRVPEHWHCDSCELWHRLLSVAQLSDPLVQSDAPARDHSAPVSPIHVLDGDDDEIEPAPTPATLIAKRAPLLTSQLLVCEYLRHIHDGQRALCARRVLLARWAGRSDGDASLLALYAALWAEASPASPSQRKVIASPAIAERTLTAVEFSESSVQRQREEALRVALLHALSDKAVKQRARAVRALGQLVSLDSSALVDDVRLASALRARLSDAAPAVREASLELLAQMPRASLLQHAELVGERTRDRSLAVRKKALGLARDLCAHCEEVRAELPSALSVASTLCARMAERMLDAEQSVRDLVRRLLHALWFERLPASSVELRVAVAWRASLLRAVVAQALEPGRSGSERVLRVLSELVQQQLAEGGAQALLVVEALVAEAIAHLSAAPSDAADAAQVAALVPVAAVLELLARACPRAVSPHAASLLPLLVLAGAPALQQQQQLLCARLASALAAALALPQTHAAAAMDALVRELTKLLYAANGSHALTGGHAPEAPLETIFESMLGFLVQYAKKTEAPQPKTRVDLVRALYVLAALCRHHTFSADAALDAASAVQSHAERAYAEAAAFFRNPELALKLVALRSLALLFAAHPRLAARSEALLRTALASADQRVRSQAVVSVEEWLADEEQLLATSARALDTAVASPLLQRLTPDLHRRLCDTEAPIRAQSLALVELALKRRLLHPLHFTAHALALTMDASAAVSDRALAVLELVKTQHDAQFLLQRIAEALALAWAPLKLPPLSADNEPDARPESSLARVYNLVWETRTQRQRVVQALVSAAEQSLDDAPRVRFLLTALVALPFREVEDVLAAVHALAKLGAYHAVAALAALKKSVSDASVARIPSLLAVLRAKRALRHLYSLSGARCVAFDPSAASDSKRTVIRPATEQQDVRGVLELSAAEEGAALHERFRREVKEDEQDMAVADAAASPTRRDSKRSRSTKGKSKGRAAKRRRRADDYEGDEDEDDDDEVMLVDEEEVLELSAEERQPQQSTATPASGRKRRPSARSRPSAADEEVMALGDSDFEL